MPKPNCLVNFFTVTMSKRTKQDTQFIQSQIQRSQVQPTLYVSSYKLTLKKSPITMPKPKCLVNFSEL